MNTKNILIIAGVIVAVLLVWGFIGGLQADDPGITCDVGLGDSLCWKWHTNVLGQAKEALDDMFNR